MTVTGEACPMWVPLVENNEFDSPGADYFVRKHLEHILAADPEIDTLVLGCTHYPLLIEKIKAFLPEGIVSELNCSSDENRIKEIYNTILTTIPDEALCVPFANTVELAAWNSDKINGYEFCSDSQYVEVSGLDLK